MTSTRGVASEAVGVQATRHRAAARSLVLAQARAAFLRLGLRWTRRVAGAPQAQASRRRWIPTLAPLEGRALLAFAPLATTVTPSTLWPPNGRYVTVKLKGEFEEFTIINNKQVFKLLPETRQASFQVVDEYRRVEPAGPIHLVSEGNGKFSYSVTFRLQASRSTEFPAGRRYYVIVGAKDNDGWAGKTLPVQVPVSLNDRGPGPIVGKPSPAYTYAHSHPRKPKAAAATPKKTGLAAVFSGL